MQMSKPAASLFLLFMMLINAPTGFAAPLDHEVDNLNQRSVLFEKFCITKEGALNSTIADTQGNRLDCQSEALALKAESTRISQTLEIDSSAVPESTCHSQTAPSDDSIASLSKDSLDASSSLSCTKQEEHAEEQSCLKQAGCNALRSMMTLSFYSATTNAFKSIQGKVSEDKNSKNSCLSTNQSDCLTELIAGVLKDIWSNVEGVWDLLKMGAGWAKDKVVSGWKAFHQAEDKTSDSALAASQQSESWIKTFISSPGSALKKMGEDLYNLVAQGVKDSFMCAKWEGQPHISKCLSPQHEAWSCATCDQKINSICGVGGFAAGEIAVAYLTGGALSLGKAAIKSGVGTVSVSAKLSKMLPKLSKTTKLKIAKVKIRSMSAVDKALGLKAVTATTGVVNLVTWPLNQYMKLMEKAFKLGIKHGDYTAAKLGAKTASLKFAQKEIYQAASSKTGKEISTNKDEILLASSQLETKEQRVEAASTLLGRKLSEQEAKAVMKAHNVGENTGHGFGTYTQAELKEKMQILKTAGIEGADAQKLMRSGVTGNQKTNLDFTQPKGDLDFTQTFPKSYSVQELEKMGQTLEQKTNELKETMLVNW